MIKQYPEALKKSQLAEQSDALRFESLCEAGVNREFDHSGKLDFDIPKEYLYPAVSDTRDFSWSFRKRIKS